MTLRRWFSPVLRCAGGVAVLAFVRPFRFGGNVYRAVDPSLCVLCFHKVCYYRQPGYHDLFFGLSGLLDSFFIV